MQVSLNRAERKVIRKIAGIQLESLAMILQGNIEQDIPLWRIEHNVSQDDLNETIRENIALYENLYTNPHEFVNLEDNDLSMVKHILHRYIKRTNLLEAKASLWRKMVYLNSFNFNPN